MNRLLLAYACALSVLGCTVTTPFEPGAHADAAVGPPAEDASAGSSSADRDAGNASCEGGECPGDAGSPVCGDGQCADEAAESCESCPADCGRCDPCGDGTCDAESETCMECPADCGECPEGGVCGDQDCRAAEGEDCASCPQDCGACPHCPNGSCEVAEAETCASCPQDCGACDPCGDDSCDAPAETCATCEADCGRCDPCGDGECAAAVGEGCQTCPQDCGACGVRPGCVQGTFSAYHGNLHSHTSYSDGVGTPGGAFQHAQDAGLDFLAVTDHMGQMEPGQWEACRDQANQRNQPGSFVAFCGYEWVVEGLGDAGTLGHFNVLFPSRKIAKPKGLQALYDTVAGCNACVGQWNHPGSTNGFGGYRYFPVGDPAVHLIEFNGGGGWGVKMAAYFRALGNGWHVSPSFNEDNHHANWGDRPHATGVWAAELTRSGLRQAIRGQRTFATEDDTATIKLIADGACWMGSVLRGIGPITFKVVARDRQNADKFDRISLLGTNGAALETHQCRGANPCTATFTRNPKSARFWVALAVQQDGDRMVSGPIWLEP